MATQTIHAPFLLPRLSESLGFFLRLLTDAVAMATGAQARFDEIVRLQSLDDAALAQRGLTRDEIVRHVYADLLAR